MSNDGTKSKQDKQETRETLTFSAGSCVLDCARRYKLRYLDHIRPRFTEHPLWFGALWHDVREAFYLDPGDLADRMAAGRAIIDAKLDGHHRDDEGNHRDWHKLHAMLRGYVKRWVTKETLLFGEEELADDAWDLVPELVEFQFIQPIMNPDTGGESRTYIGEGKVDEGRRSKSSGRLSIVEAKTAAQVDAGYIDKLWIDEQIHTYAMYAGRKLGEPIESILYDVAGKCKLVQKSGESAEKFAERMAGYKTEKTIEKHRQLGPKPAETDAQYAARLDDWYDSSEAFTRILILVDAASLRDHEENIWGVTQALLGYRRRDYYPANRRQCYGIARTCPYVPICKNGGVMDEVISNLYEIKGPHEELAPTQAATESDPF